MFTNKIIKEKWWIITLFSIFIFSFLLDMYVLTRYNLSYGMDGPFYDLQVLNILKTGLPASNDPPLVYYILTPFVMICGNSFCGIKIGMALIGSLMAFPAFLLTEMFSEKISIESKIPALLSAFLITVNIFYFQLIGDFMQNLVGVFFLLLLIYFAVKWMQNQGEWKKYGILAIAILLCNIFTHIYTGILAVILFISLLLFNWVLISYKTGKIEISNLKILGIVSILVIGGLAVLFAVYPYMFSKFTTVLSFLNNSSTSGTNLAGGNFVNPIIFLTVPFILGLLVTIYILYNGLKEKITVRDVIRRRTLLAWVYLVMTAVLISLAVAPSVDSQYKSRFIELAFVPIALMVPLGLKFIENWLSKRYPSKKRLKLGLISLIAVIFAISSFYTAAGVFSSMGPSITSDQYNNLVSIKENLTSNNIDTNGIILVDDYHTGYWVEYVLRMQVETGNLSEIQKEYPNRAIYAVTLTQNSQSQLKGNSEYSWNPLLPYSFPLGGWNFSNSFNSAAGQKQLSQNISGSPPGDLRNATGQNRSGAPPNNLGSKGQNNNVPFNITGSGPNNVVGVGNGPGNGVSSSGMSNQNLNQIISNYGTLIFSGSNFKIYKIS
ncbi:MAG TPA: glycosyltransferase family 39 protein [Methanobacterium sp.]|nr:glycosyltransferase family 39 protein [Methanobacterium sp.]